MAIHYLSLTRAVSFDVMESDMLASGSQQHLLFQVLTVNACVSKQKLIGKRQRVGIQPSMRKMVMRGNYSFI